MGCENESEQAQENDAQPLARRVPGLKGPHPLGIERSAAPLLGMTPAKEQPGLSELMWQAGIPNVRAVAEHVSCSADLATGELHCTNLDYPPAKDCRKAYCPHAPVMRSRLHGRLRAVVARRTQGGR